MERNNILLIVFLFIQYFVSFSQVPKTKDGKIIHIESFVSKNIDARSITIWLPDGYDSLKKYPVLYMHDGQMLFDSTLTWNKQEWRIDETMTQLIFQNQINPCIIVGIWNNNDKRRFEYMPQKPFQKLSKDSQYLIRKQLMDQPTSKPYEMKADIYLKFIVKELKPFIDNRFSTLRNQSNTFIGGSSFGGMISWYAICEYPQIFGAAICLSTHWPGLFPGGFNNELPNAFYTYLKKKLPSSNSHKIYFDYGTETLDAYYEPYQQKVDKIMDQRGFNASNWMSLKFIGEDHSENAWANRFEYPLQFLLRK